MKHGFLEQEALRAGRKNRKLFITLLIIYLILISATGFAVKDSIDLSEYRTIKVVVCLTILSVLMLLSIVYGLYRSFRIAAKGQNLILPFKDTTKEAAAEIIDREAAAGNIQAERYAEYFPEGKKPHGERLVLLPSYLLLINYMGAVTAIPRDKIYWICPQTGRKGRSSFIVRLMFFTEKQTYYMEGTDPGYFESIASELYQYIPNIFSDYDPFTLSYELDSLFDKNREEFLNFYEAEKKKMQLNREP